MLVVTISLLHHEHKHMPWLHPPEASRPGRLVESPAH